MICGKKDLRRIVTNHCAGDDVRHQALRRARSAAVQNPKEGFVGVTALRVPLESLATLVGEHLNGVEERVWTRRAQRGVSLTRPAGKVRREENDRRHVTRETTSDGIRPPERLPHRVGSQQPAPVTGERARDVEEPSVAFLVLGNKVDRHAGLGDAMVAFRDGEARVDENLFGKLLRSLAFPRRPTLKVLFNGLGGRVYAFPSFGAAFVGSCSTSASCTRRSAIFTYSGSKSYPM